MKLFPKNFVRKFQYAFQGLWDGLCHDRSIQLQAMLGFFVVLVCMFLSLTFGEWIVILAMVLLVIAAEFLNSSLEGIVDILCPHYDERAKRIKDYGAAMVLLISVLAALAGVYIIGGKFL